MTIAVAWEVVQQTKPKQLYFPANNNVQIMFTPIFISDKNTELRNNVNPNSKKLKISRFMDFLFFVQKAWKKWEKKQSIMSLSMLDREISPLGL